MLEPLTKFTSKSGQEIEIHLPSLGRVEGLLFFINRLTKEDTFLSLTGQLKTLAEEENWIKNAILNMKAGRSFVVWAIYQNKLPRSKLRGIPTGKFVLSRFTQLKASSKQASRYSTSENKIVGQVDVHRGGTRDWHVGKIGLMVDKDFRQDGIGKFLLEYILKQSKKMGIKTAVLDSFADNIIAIAFYKKMGFREFARLPKGFYRKGKYSDKIEMYKNLL